MVEPPGNVWAPARSSVSSWSVTGRGAPDSRRNRRPKPDTIAVVGASAGKMASTRKPCCAVSASKSSSKRSVATTTCASRTPSTAPVATEARDVVEDQAVLVEDDHLDRLHHAVVAVDQRIPHQHVTAVADLVELTQRHSRSSGKVAPVVDLDLAPT